ncbi:MAG: polyhydroxyalkanoate synthesis regulator DNA-binding domain-containing protein [Candidatus Dormibacteraceae bacterium]
MTSRRLIKKYANRKLYDTSSSRYVTLSGIERLVHQGHDIQVIERETGRDITPFILSQVVMTEERRVETGTDDGLQRGQALLDYVRRTLNVPAALVSGEVERRREDFESMVDLAISRALKRLNIPTRRDLDRINRRLDEVVAQMAGGGGSRPVPPSAPPSRRAPRRMGAAAGSRPDPARPDSGGSSRSALRASRRQRGAA